MFRIEARRRNRQAPIVEYVSRNGVHTYNRDRAARYKRIADAQEELDYFARTYPGYEYAIETVKKR